MFARIVVPTDFSGCSEVAGAYARRIAAQSGGTITYLHVDVWGAPDDHGVAPPEHRPPDVRGGEEIEARLNGIVETARKDGVNAEGRCVRSLAIGPAVIDVARSMKADVIIMGTHGYRGFRRFVLGSNTEEVLRTACCPLLTVPESCQFGDRPIQRILIPVDFSGSTHRQVSVGIDLARRFDSDVALVYSVEPLPIPRILTGFGTLGDLSPSLDQQADRELAHLAARVEGRLGRPVRYLRRSGSPAKQIIEAADEIGADLILLARHGLSSVQRFLLGSVTEKTARTSNRPLLVLTDDVG